MTQQTLDDIIAAFQTAYKKAKEAYTDLPIPPDLHPPSGWEFNLCCAQEIPTLWDFAHVVEVLWRYRCTEQDPLSTMDGLNLQRIAKVWLEAASPEEQARAMALLQARLNNMQYRLWLQVLNADHHHGAGVGETRSFSR